MLTVQRSFALAALATLVYAIAPQALAQAKPAAQSCAARIAAGTAKANSAIDPSALLDQAMKGKPFKLNEMGAVASMDMRLVEVYGLKQSLRSVPDEQHRRSVFRIATLVENDYVIAAQMALGVALKAGEVPSAVESAVSRYVNTLTEPYAEDAELDAISKSIERATLVIEGIAPKPRAFSRWAVRAYAYEDAVAIDASLNGFCSSPYTSVDEALLKKAIDIAKLDRSKVPTQR